MTQSAPTTVKIHTKISISKVRKCKEHILSTLPDIPQTRLCGQKIAPRYAVFHLYGRKIAISWRILPSIHTDGR